MNDPVTKQCLFYGAHFLLMNGMADNICSNRQATVNHCKPAKCTCVVLLINRPVIVDTRQVCLLNQELVPKHLTDTGGVSVETQTEDCKFRSRQAGHHM